MSDTVAAIEQDVAAVGRIQAVPSLLRVLCETTGMGFAVVARVTDTSWTACAVQDDIAFGLLPGGQLELDSTFCKEVREARHEIVIEHASRDPVYGSHSTPRRYSIEGYISVPIILPDGEFFGTLCAIDRRPAALPPRVVNTFKLFAELIAVQLDNERRHERDRAQLLDVEQTGDLREQFIAVLGHDLRNPLAAIAACSQLLSRKARDPEAVSHLSTRIGANVKRMSALIDDVLDFARGRLGSGISIHAAPVTDLERSLAAVVAELQDTHPEREIEATIDIPTAVHCDRNRIQQLLSNLLANALTHGAPDCEVKVGARVVGADLEIEVLNHGEPVPPASMDKIFAPFWRQSTSTRREGLGLGLYICDQIAKAHAGSLRLSSSLADGTRFTAVLPLAGPPVEAGAGAD